MSHVITDKNALDADTKEDDQLCCFLVTSLNLSSKFITLYHFLRPPRKKKKKQVDYNLFGMGYIHVSKIKFRHPVPEVVSNRKPAYNDQREVTEGL